PLLLAGCIALALSACGPRDDARQATAQAAPTSIEEVDLIPREALFGNPERTNVQISPDGAWPSWAAPVDGVLNVWVAPADDLNGARPVTDDTGRGIRGYFWSHQPGTLLYVRDTGGDEDFHLYALDLEGGEARDLTPFEKTTATVVAVSRNHPGSILVGMNDRDPQWHDLYRVDLATGERTLVEENTGQIAGYMADADYTLRYAMRSRPDGGMDILRREGDGWEVHDAIPFEDSMSTSPGGLTFDGRTLYMRDSRDRNTSALYAIDTATGERSLVHEDDRADVGRSLSDPATGEVQAVAVNYLRNDWTVLDKDIAADLEKLEQIGPGEVSVGSRTLDDSIWIVTYSAAEAPAKYYRYRSEE